eukprot:GILI01011501.1.p1 GENE.GILI01011501.1~~GILI01011501.1.p1  ORF type:complete len:327 (-),score=92.26 GILI01011501.1:288-1205(-)
MSQGPTFFDKISSVIANDIIRLRFRPVQDISKGRYCMVKFVQDINHMDAPLAIKVVDLTQIPSEKEKQYALDEIRHEFEIQKELRHEGIIPIYEYIFEGTMHILTMQLLKGLDLVDRLQQFGHMSEELAARHIAQLADVLAYLHEKNVVHRNVSPENVIFESMEPQSRVMLGDFGFACKLKGKFCPKEAVGTKRYMAPEMLALTNYGKEVDVWGLGSVAFIMLTGRAPFDNEQDALQSKYFFCPQFSHLSLQAQDLIKKMLVREPRQRLTAVGILHHPFIKHYCPEYALRHKTDRICSVVECCLM